MLFPAWFAFSVQVPARNRVTDVPDTEQIDVVEELKLIDRPALEDIVGTKGDAVRARFEIIGKVIVCNPRGETVPLALAPSPPVVTATKRTV